MRERAVAWEIAKSFRFFWAIAPSIPLVFWTLLFLFELKCSSRSLLLTLRLLPLRLEAGGKSAECNWSELFCWKSVTLKVLPALNSDVLLTFSYIWSYLSEMWGFVTDSSKEAFSLTLLVVSKPGRWHLSAVWAMTFLSRSTNFSSDLKPLETSRACRGYTRLLAIGDIKFLNESFLGRSFSEFWARLWT